MHRQLLDLLVDPVSQTPLTLTVHESDAADDVISGELRSASGQVYPIRDGVPRFVHIEDSGQKQTQGTFGFKWGREDSYGSAGMQDYYEGWMVEKYGFGTPEAARSYFSGRARILDAGCGAGFPAAFWIVPGWQQGDAAWVGLDISPAIDLAHKRLGGVAGTHFVQGDVLQAPFAPGSFDTIFSEGVLHHTPSTERAFKALVPLLAPGGEMMFYVYRKKGPIREFTDDYIREAIADLPPEEAWEALRPMTRLGQALAELKVTVDVPEDIPLLGIEAGQHDVQRLIYWHFAKMYWNEALTFEENHHINFDWYHPRYAHRQTRADITRWCQEAGLRITYLHEQESGYTVRGMKE